MPGKTLKRVLDSHAVLALLENETGADEVAGVLADGEPWMTLVNLGEVAYIIERERGSDAADVVWANLTATDGLPGPTIRFLDVDEALVRQAASLKARGGMSYADCFAAAAASRLACPVMTGDPEFEVAEQVGIEVHWLGRHRT